MKYDYEYEYEYENEHIKARQDLGVLHTNQEQALIFSEQLPTGTRRINQEEKKEEPPAID
jgi:hypothetical protein